MGAACKLSCGMSYEIVFLRELLEFYKLLGAKLFIFWDWELCKFWKLEIFWLTGELDKIWFWFVIFESLNKLLGDYNPLVSRLKVGVVFCNIGLLRVFVALNSLEVFKLVAGYWIFKLWAYLSLCSRTYLGII